MKISTLSLMIIPIIFLTSYAHAETFDVVFFKGISHNDRNDTIEMKFYNNTLSGSINHNSQVIDFEDLLVKFYENSFMVRDFKLGFIISGDDLLHGNDITIIFIETRQVEKFKIFETEKVILIGDRVDILEKFAKYSETIANESLLESLQNLEEWQQSMDTPNIPTHDYSNDMEIVNPQGDSFVMSVNFVDLKDTVLLNSELDLKVFAKNIRNGTYLDGADITVEIIDEDFVLLKWTDTLDIGGYAYFNIDAIYPMFYPTHKYEIKATVDYGNYTSIHSEDFCVEVPYLREGSTTLEYWEENADLEYADSSRYDWLPWEYTVFPRETNSYDDCD